MIPCCIIWLILVLYKCSSKKHHHEKQNKQKNDNTTPSKTESQALILRHTQQRDTKSRGSWRWLFGFVARIGRSRHARRSSYRPRFATDLWADKSNRDRKYDPMVESTRSALGVCCFVEEALLLFAKSTMIRGSEGHRWRFFTAHFVFLRIDELVLSAVVCAARDHTTCCIFIDKKKPPSAHQYSLMKWWCAGSLSE